MAIPAPVTAQRFAICAEDCRPVLVSWRAQEQKVVLGAGVRVKVRWQAPVPRRRTVVCRYWVVVCSLSAAPAVPGSGWRPDAA
jgi:hypothetical protein